MWQTARSFNLRKVLQNLQAYKISSGQLTSNDIALLTEKYNFDPEKLKGAVYIVCIICLNSLLIVNLVN